MEREKNTFSKVIDNLVTDYKDNSIYICQLSAEGFTQTAVKACELHDYLESMEIMKDRNYYITPNAYKPFYMMKKGEGGRKNQNIASLNNIVLDIDNERWHECQELADPETLEDLVACIVSLWGEDTERPEIATIVTTGRGIQVWFRLEPTSAQSEKMQNIYKMTKQKLGRALMDIIEPFEEFEGFEFDACSLKIGQVMRLPISGAYNYKSGTPIKYEDITTRSYRLYDMFQMLSDIPLENMEKKEKKEKKETKEKQKKEKKQTKKEKKQADRTPHKSPFLVDRRNLQPEREDEYTRLMLKRMRWIENIIRNNSNQNGRRNSMLLIYYTSALQVYDISDAFRLLNDLNNSLYEPLTQLEIANIVKECAKNAKGFYKYSVEKVFEILRSTEEERKAYKDASEGWQERDEKRKKERAEKKAERDAYVLAVYGECQTVAGTARITGISRNTVRKIIEASKREEHKQMETDKQTSQTEQQTAQPRLYYFDIIEGSEMDEAEKQQAETLALELDWFKTIRDQLTA